MGTPASVQASSTSFLTFAFSSSRSEAQDMAIGLVDVRVWACVRVREMKERHWGIVWVDFRRWVSSGVCVVEVGLGGEDILVWFGYGWVGMVWLWYEVWIIEG